MAKSRKQLARIITKGAVAIWHIGRVGLCVYASYLTMYPFYLNIMVKVMNYVDSPTSRPTELKL